MILSASFQATAGPSRRALSAASPHIPRRLQGEEDAKEEVRTSYGLERKKKKKKKRRPERKVKAEEKRSSRVQEERKKRK
jgi:hypothetical protein